MNFSHVSGSRAAACALLVAITPVLSAQSSQTRPLNLSKLRMESHGVSTTSGTVGYGPGFKAIFEKRSVDFRVQGGHAIELEFEAVSRGGALLRHASESPSLSHADRVVTYDHGGGLTERYDVRLEGVEQSFVFDEPLSGDGDLVVRLSLETVLTRDSNAQGLQFRTADGSTGIAIGDVVGIDAKGRRADGSVRFDGGLLELTLPDAFVDTASYPLVLDPLIGLIDSFDIIDLIDRNPTVAYESTNGRRVVVWENYFGPGDSDLFAGIIPPSQSPFISALMVGVEDTRNPDVGSIKGGETFLVAFEYAAGNLDTDPADIYGLNFDPLFGTPIGLTNLTVSPQDEQTPHVSGNVDVSAGFDATALVSFERCSTLITPFGCTEVELLIRRVRAPFFAPPTLPSPNAFVATGGVVAGSSAACKGMGDSERTLVTWAGTDGAARGQLVQSDLTFPGSPFVIDPGSGITSTAVDGDGQAFSVLTGGGGLFNSEVTHHRVLAIGPPTVTCSTATQSGLVATPGFAVGHLQNAGLVLEESVPPTANQVTGRTFLPGCQACENPIVIDGSGGPNAVNPAMPAVATLYSATPFSDLTPETAAGAFLAWADEDTSDLSSSFIYTRNWSSNLGQATVTSWTFGNPDVLTVNGPPVVGSGLFASIDHTTGFMPTAFVDFIFLSSNATFVPLPGGQGTLLAVFPGFLLLSGPPGLPQPLGIPADCSLVGFSARMQGISWMPGPGNFALTNALDLTIGNYSL